MPARRSPLAKLRPRHCRNNSTATATANPQKGFHTEASPSRSTGHQKPARFVFPSLLKSCTARLDLNHGKSIHAALLQTGLQSDPFIAASLITLYARCGPLADAAHVFDQLLQRDATVWNAMVAGHFHHGRWNEGLSLFLGMQSSGVRPDGHSLSILLSACGNNCFDLGFGRQAHTYIVRNGLDGDPFLATALINMYAKCGTASEAYRVFDGADVNNVSAWNVMIAGFCQNGSWERSLELFSLLRRDGPKPQSATFSSVLTACSIGEESAFGEVIHSCVLKLGFDLDPYVCTSLLAMYARCAMVNEACRVFLAVPSKGITLWNSLISAYIGNGCAYEALVLYKKMRLGDVGCDGITISNVLSACSMAGLLDYGRAIHAELVKQPELATLVVQSSLMTMYMKSGSIEDAVTLFRLIMDWDIVVWGSMISGLCQNKKFDYVLALFNQLRAKELIPDSTIIASAASACAGLECVQVGFQIHGHAIKSGMSSDVFVGSALIDMYAKCRVPQSAGNVLSDIPYKNVPVWNSLISGYSQNSLIDQSIQAFAQISQNGLVPDSISITSVLASVSSLAALMKGKMIHAFQLRHRILGDIHAENALLDMYTKCGCLRYAQSLFDRMQVTNVVAWNTMITGFGSHGHCLEAIKLFEEMQISEVLPDDTTFLSLITSCSHTGLVEEGMAFFQTMIKFYGIIPRMEHYANMVDLLGRAGRLNEAYCFIMDMPIRPDESVWLCFLSACRARQATYLGEIAADHLLKVNPEGSGSYTQLLNFYGEVGMSDNAASVKVQMREARVKKNPGCSWIELKDRVVIFYSGDSSSPLIIEIHDTLTNLRKTMRAVDEFS